MDEYGQCPTIICNLQDEEHSFAMYMYQPLPTEDLSEVGKQTTLCQAQLNRAGYKHKLDFEEEVAGVTKRKRKKKILWLNLIAWI